MEAFVGTHGPGGLLALLAVLGALLGGALGHWRRGSGRIVSGAIIGAILLPLAALSYLFHLGIVIVGAVVLAVLAALSGLLG